MITRRRLKLNMFIQSSELRTSLHKVVQRYGIQVLVLVCMVESYSSPSVFMIHDR